MFKAKVGDPVFDAGVKAGREEMRKEALGLFERYFMDRSVSRDSERYKVLKEITRDAARELKA